MNRNIWHHAKLETPECDGVYEVRLAKKNDLLDCPIETIMEYKDGEWLLRVPAFINEYFVSAWRNR